MASPRMATASSVIGPSLLAAADGAEEHERDGAHREDEFRKTMREREGERHS